MDNDIDLKIEDREVQDLMDKLYKRSSDMTPAMEVVGDIFLSSIARNFDVGGRYSEPGSWRGGSNKWQPLSAATLLAGFKKKRDLTKRGGYRKGFVRSMMNSNRHILIKEGVLMGSITKNASSTGVEVGTNVPYAAIHNFGGEAGRKNHRVKIPARPFLVVQDEDLEEAKRVLTRFLLNG